MPGHKLRAVSNAPERCGLAAISVASAAGGPSAGSAATCSSVLVGPASNGAASNVAASNGAASIDSEASARPKSAASSGVSSASSGETACTVISAPLADAVSIASAIRASMTCGCHCAISEGGAGYSDPATQPPKVKAPRIAICKTRRIMATLPKNLTCTLTCLTKTRKRPRCGLSSGPRETQKPRTRPVASRALLRYAPRLVFGKSGPTQPRATAQGTLTA